MCGLKEQKGVCVFVGKRVGVFAHVRVGVQECVDVRVQVCEFLGNREKGILN